MTEAVKNTPILRAEKSVKEKSPVRAAAEQLESFFVSHVLQTMFEGIPCNGISGGGKGEEMFRSMLLDEYANITVASNGIGIADAIEKQYEVLASNPAAKNQLFRSLDQLNAVQAQHLGQNLDLPV